MLSVEAEVGEPIDVHLRRLYYEENLTLWAIGERLGINFSTVWRWLRWCQIAPKQMRPPAATEAVA